MNKWKFCVIYYTLLAFGSLAVGFGIGVDRAIRYNLNQTIANIALYGGLIFIFIMAIYFRKEFKEFKAFLKKS